MTNNHGFILDLCFPVYLLDGDTAVLYDHCLSYNTSVHLRPLYLKGHCHRVLKVDNGVAPVGWHVHDIARFLHKLNRGRWRGS